jgi:hypothetical protein
MTPIIAITFIILSSIVLYIFIFSPGIWWVKVPVMFSVIYFSFVLLFSVSTYLGWASVETPPDKFELLGSYVVEDEIVYMTVIEMEDKKSWRQNPALSWLGYSSSAGEPRLYSYPYNRELHEMMEQADAMLKEGKRVVIEFGELKDEKKEEVEDGDGNNDDGKQGNKSNDRDEAEFKFYELPPVSMGVK